MAQQTGGGGGEGGGTSASPGYSHGEGTATPDGRPEAAEPAEREDTTPPLTDELRPDEIYGGRADVAGMEDDVEGADEDAAG